MRSQITSFRIATTFIGTVLGAGFASGQEILQFFGFFGRSGILALALTTVLFVFFGTIILDLGYCLRARSYLEIISHLAGVRLSRLVDRVIAFFLFGTLSIMVAGSGAIFAEQFRLPDFWGSLLLAAAASGTVLFGMAGVISAMGMIIPLLLFFIMAIGLGTLMHGFNALTSASTAQPHLAPVSFWPFSSLLYASYNLTTGVAILAPLGGMVKPELIRKGVALGSLGIGASALAILLGILIHYPQVRNCQIPMLYIAGQLFPPAQALYSLVLLAGMYTAAVACLYGFAARWSSPFLGTRFKWLVIVSSAIAFIAAQAGFSTLVRYLYPLAGLAGLFLLAGLTYHYLKRNIRALNS